jgi:hypothetical protein
VSSKINNDTNPKCSDTGTIRVCDTASGEMERPLAVGDDDGDGDDEDEDDDDVDHGWFLLGVRRWCRTPSCSA